MFQCVSTIALVALVCMPQRQWNEANVRRDARGRFVGGGETYTTMTQSSGTLRKPTARIQQTNRFTGSGNGRGHYQVQTIEW